MAVDGTVPLLLHMASASAPTGSLYAKALLIGRMRTPRGGEILINSVPFASTDHENIRKYAEQVGRSFVPRPQGPQSAIAVTTPAFDAFRAILKKRENQFALLQASITRSYGPPSGRVGVKGTQFPQATWFRRRPGSIDPQVERLYKIHYRALHSRAQRAALRFDPPGQGAGPHALLRLRTNAPCCGCDHLTGGACGGAGSAETRRARELVAPDLGFQADQPYAGSLDELAGRVKALAEVARQYQCTLSIHNGSGKQAAVHEIIGRATLGRFNYEAGAEADIATLADNLLA